VPPELLVPSVDDPPSPVPVSPEPVDAPGAEFWGHASGPALGSHVGVGDAVGSVVVVASDPESPEPVVGDGELEGEESEPESEPPGAGVAPDPSSVLDGSAVEVGVPVDEPSGGVSELSAPPEPPFAPDLSGVLPEPFPAPSPLPPDSEDEEGLPDEVGDFLSDPLDEDDEDPLPWYGLWL
jgi:hypothetical protein